MVKQLVCNISAMINRRLNLKGYPFLTMIGLSSKKDHVNLSGLKPVPKLVKNVMMIMRSA